MLRKSLLMVAMFVVVGLGALSWVSAQSGTRQSAPGSSPRVVPARPKPTFDQQLWTYLKDAQYRNWAPMPGFSAGAYEGQSPHGARLKLYANRVAVGGAAALPHGSVIVKENFDASGENLMAITVMYRSKGFDPNNNDWYWVKYQPDGNTARANGQPIAGRVNSCIECHAGAAGNDYSFAND